MDKSRATRFLTELGLKYPIIQAPMAGVTTTKMVALVSQNGGLGSLPVSHIDFRRKDGIEKLRNLITETTEHSKDILMTRRINLNFFCHEPKPKSTISQINNWFDLYQDTIGKTIKKDLVTFDNVNVSFKEYERGEPFEDLLDFFSHEFRPRVVSFHFGHPSKHSIERFQELGILVFVTATSVKEITLLNKLGVDGIICQGYEAGGHRGNFLQDNLRHDGKLSTVSLLDHAIKNFKKYSHNQPFLIPAGGISNAVDVKYMLDMGSSAVQVGTAFLGTQESKIGKTVNEILFGSAIPPTNMIDFVSGKPARAICTPFLKELSSRYHGQELPPYPYMYCAFKKLRESDPHSVDFILAGTKYSSIQKGINTDRVLEQLAKFNEPSR